MNGIDCFGRKTVRRLAHPVAELGIADFSTQLGIDNGTLTGTVESYLATRHEKKAAINHLIEAHPYAGSFGFEDSEGDIEMLQVIEHPVCIRPTPGLAKIAHERGWTVVESQDDLDSRSGLRVVSLTR